MFSCAHCGACCRDFIVKFCGCHIGLFLMSQEVSLFPADMVSPMWAVGTKGRSRSRPDVKAFQLNVKDCPYITLKNLCRIYERRPMVCRAHPLSIHANPTTMRITSASVDSGCVTCKELGIGEEGTYQILGKCFPEDILRANATMTSYLSWMFKMTGEQVWLYDLNTRQWKELTAEIIEAAR